MFDFASKITSSSLVYYQNHHSSSLLAVHICRHLSATQNFVGNQNTSPELFRLTAQVLYRSSLQSTRRNRKLISKQHFVISGGFEWDERVQPFRIRHTGNFFDAKYIWTKMYNFKVVQQRVCGLMISLISLYQFAGKSMSKIGQYLSQLWTRIPVSAFQNHCQDILNNQLFNIQRFCED